MTTDAPDDDPAEVLSAARETLRIERRRTVDEREAFETFQAQVRRVSSETTIRGDSPLRSDGAGPAVGDHGGPDTLDRLGQLSEPDSRAVPGSPLVEIRDAYVETVMSVPHYETEYDDTYESSLAAEFGSDLAVALTQEPTLGHQVKSALLSKTDEAIAEREQLFDALDTESESLDCAAAQLHSIHNEIVTLSADDPSELRFGTLDAYRVRTQTLEDDCDSVATRRQREIAGMARSLQLDESVPDLATYLYYDLPVTYPALAAVGQIGERIKHLQQLIEREMIHWE